MSYEVLHSPEVESYEAQQLGAAAAYAAAVNELWVINQGAEGVPAARDALEDAAYMLGSRGAAVAARVFASSRNPNGANDIFETLQAEARSGQNPVQGPMIPASMLAEATATSLGFESTAAMAAQAQYMHDQFMMQHIMHEERDKSDKKRNKAPFSRSDDTYWPIAA